MRKLLIGGMAAAAAITFAFPISTAHADPYPPNYCRPSVASAETTQMCQQAWDLMCMHDPTTCQMMRGR